MAFRREFADLLQRFFGQHLGVTRRDFVDGTNGQLVVVFVDAECVGDFVRVGSGHERQNQQRAARAEARVAVALRGQMEGQIHDIRVRLFQHERPNERGGTEAVGFQLERGEVQLGGGFKTAVFFAVMPSLQQCVAQARHELGRVGQFADFRVQQECHGLVVGDGAQRDVSGFADFGGCVGFGQQFLQLRNGFCRAADSQ